MAQLMDHVEYLSREIGARPAGTEEEQQAALYIADQLQSEAGFPANIEEFKSSSNLEGGRAILAMITIVVSILAMLFNVLTLPALVLAAAAAAVYYLEAYDRPVLSSVLARGASQNVVAKYQPGGQAASDKKPRKRKVVLVAHYDTGKVTPGLVSKVESLGQPVGAICAGAMCAAAVLLLLRLFVGGTGGFVVVLLNVLTIIALVACAYPVAKAILYRMAPYNEGANNNATGVAALIETARRINLGSVSEADLAAAEAEVRLHGEEAALESGLVPEGAEFEYAATGFTAADPDDASEEDRLLAAKAAIAALTGRPVEQRVFATQEGLAAADEPRRAQMAAAPVAEMPPAVAGGEDAGDARDAGAEGGAAPSVPSISVPEIVSVPAIISVPEVISEPEDAAGFENAPSWFVAAQRNAKKTAPAEPVQRSRYALAIEAAEREAAAREQARLEEERAARERELREREEAARAELAARQERERLEREEAKAKARAEREALAAEEAAEREAAAAAETPSADLGATLAYTPAQIRKALEEEKAEMERLAAEAAATPAEEDAPDSPAAADESAAEAADARAAESGPAGEAPAEEAPAAAPTFDNKGRLVGLPSIGGDPETAAPAAKPVPETTNPSRSGLFRMLRTDVPSLSGVIRLQEAGQDVSQSAEDIAAANAARDEQPVDYDMEVPIGGEGAEDLASSSPASADATQEEAAAPSDGKGLFSRFRRKDKERLSDSPQEWLDIEGDFDPRAVGRERGSWESFRPGQEGGKPQGGSGKWQGGAFSRVRLGRVSMLSGKDSHSDEPEQLEESYEDQQLNEEIESIYHFRNPSYDTEIWFVAIGSDTELHDGAKAFVAEHRNELRGSMIIEVESLGLGPLAVVDEEGQFRKVQSSSRVKRYTRPATEATGIVLDSATTATDSVSSTIQKEGYQVIHLTGVEDGKPSLKGSADDVLENVDEMTLLENVDFLMELLKRG